VKSFRLLHSGLKSRKVEDLCVGFGEAADVAEGCRSCEKRGYVEGVEDRDFRVGGRRRRRKVRLRNERRVVNRRRRTKGGREDERIRLSAFERMAVLIPSDLKASTAT